MLGAVCVSHFLARREVLTIICLELLQGQTYGWLTCLNGAHFIERVAPHTYNFTSPIKAISTQPTVFEMLTCESQQYGMAFGA